MSGDRAREGAGAPPQAKTPEFASVRRAALWVPDWPVAAAVAEGLAAAHEPVVICGPRGVLATSPAARATGVRRGMRRRTAQSLCPDLAVVEADDSRDARAFEPVVQAAQEVVAGVELARPGLLLMAARGPVRYLGSEDALASALVGSVAEITGVECQVGIADGLLAAVLAAREFRPVAPGGSREFLAGHDVRQLQHIAFTRQHHVAMHELLDVLRRLGVRRLGTLAALPAGDVLARFGATGAQAHRLACGHDLTPPTVRRPEEDVSVAADLDPPAERGEVAVFAARRLAERLADQLARRGAGCGRVTVTAHTTEGGELARTWRIDDVPSATDLTDRVRWQLDGWLSGRSGQRPGAPVARIRLLAEEVAPAGGMGEGLWGRRDRGDAEAERVVTRVQALLGEDAVQVPVLQGGRDPVSRVRMVTWGDDAAAVLDPAAPWPGRLPDPAPSIVLARPEQAELYGENGEPVRVDERGLLDGAPHRLLVSQRNRVVQGWSGPWQVRERWWEPGGGSRAWLQLDTAEDGVLLLELRENGWQLVARYD